MPRRILPPTVRGDERVTLGRELLDELRRVSNLPLASAQEAELEDICTDHLVWVRFEQASSLAGTATEIFDNLQTQLEDVVTSIAHILGTETPQHHHVHLEIDEHLEKGYPTESYSVDKLLRQIMALQRAGACALKEHKLMFGGRGRPATNEGLRMFIWTLADLFEQAGGRPTAPYQGMLEKPDSPFVRWVGLLNEYLPSDVRAKKALLPDLVRDVCRIRRHKRTLRH
jgi:hypothetical protein